MITISHYIWSGTDLDNVDTCPWNKVGLLQRDVRWTKWRQLWYLGLNYLVKIDSHGRLIWAKNNQFVDTAAGQWRDTGAGGGIVPFDPPSSSRLRTGLSASSVSSKQANAATHYTGKAMGKYRWSKYLRRHFTPRGIVQHLLRKTVRRNTWIYVSVC